MPSDESAAATSGPEQPKGGAKDTQPERTAALISLYAAILANAASLGSRRQTTNDVFVGINIAVLSGLGYLTLTAQVLSWRVVAVLAIVTAGITPVNRVWSRALSTYARSLSIHYDVLRQIEARWKLPLGWGVSVGMSVSDTTQLYTRLGEGSPGEPVGWSWRTSTTTAELSLARYFTFLYPLLTLGAAVLTYLVRSRILALPS